MKARSGACSKARSEAAPRCASAVLRRLAAPIPRPFAQPFRRKPTGFTHQSSIASGSALPDPCSASRPSPFHGSRATARTPERPSLDGLWRASLDPCARLRLLASMIVAAKAGLATGSEQQRSWKQIRRIGTAQSPRSGRSEAEERRSRLTASSRCGRRHPKGA